MRKSLLGLTALAVAMPAFSAPALAHGRHYDGGYHQASYERDYDRRYDRRARYDGRQYCRRSDGTTGLIIGGVLGALAGRAIDTRGDRLPGTVVGGGAGALIGREIERGRSCR